MPTGRRIPLLALMLALVVTMLAACDTSGARSPARVVTQSTPSPNATATATAQPKVIYVAIGASDAVGVGATDPAHDGYVPRIIARLPAGTDALNTGISGATIRQALQRELPEAVGEHPTLITVWMVGNDFRQCTPLAQYADDLDTLLGLLEETKAYVFVGNTPDMSLLPYFQQGAPGGGACVQGAAPAQVHALAVQWNAVINPLVAKHHAVLVNLFSSDLASHPEFVARDGFHPSSQGYARLADLFWAQITATHAVPAAP